MRTRDFIGLLPFMLAGQAAMPMMEPVKTGYGSIGYNGFVGSNADKKKHFNKKRHGHFLKRKHKRALA
jgi:hypothetical protein